ncbi:hypothetical protein LCGC14_1518440 [marine sediment metagenome]|uniref:Uncharacterized protein n=1 Tax=marine sediment metagenome TaxID=412755 RepID=A0A0F9JK88_9ZZZZ
MKVRTGFVSNSSSASFFCAICDKLYDVMDGDPTSSPYRLSTCKNFHGFCIEHMLGSEERILELMRETVIKSPTHHIDNIDLMSTEQLKELFERDDDGRGEFIDERLYLFISEFFTSIPEELCPICSFKIIRDKDLQKYLLATSVKKEVAEEIKRKFSSFQEFLTFLREREE